MTATTRTMNYEFDATQFNPESQFEIYPAGNYLLAIDSTEIRAVGKQGEQKGDEFNVGFVFLEGEHKGKKVFNNYKLWYRDAGNTDEKVAQTCKIAHEQLSALCHVVGVYKINMNNVGADLKGKQLRVELGVSNDGKYNNFKQVFDVGGNKPKRAGSGMPPASPVAMAVPGAPAQYAPQGGFAPQPVAAQPQQYAPAPVAAPAAPYAPQSGFVPPPAPVQAPQGIAPAPGWNQQPQAAPAAQGVPANAPWGQQPPVAG